MGGLSLTEEYALLIFHHEKKKKALFYETGKPSGILMAIYTQLFLSGAVVLDENQLVAVSIAGLPDGSDYLNLVYKNIAAGKPRTLEEMALNYIVSLNDKPMKQITSLVQDALVKKECLSISVKKSLLSKKVVYHTSIEQIDQTLQKLNTQLIGQAVPEENTIALAAILYYTRLLKHYFCENEQQAIKQRLQVVKMDDRFGTVNAITDLISATVSVVGAKTNFSG